GCGIGILVLPEVFLGERVNVRGGAVLGDALDPAADLHVAVRVVRIDDRERDRRARFQSAGLDPALGGVHANAAVRVGAPDRRDLRRTVRHGGRKAGECLLLLQQIEKLLGDRGHGCAPFWLLTAQAYWKISLNFALIPRAWSSMWSRSAGMNLTAESAGWPV